MSGAAGQPEHFGGFTLGSLQLALPMEALREVVACTELIDLPCPAVCVIGGICLRGVVVPVVDLRIVLGRPAAPASGRSVVVMVHEGNLLGLLADAVTGIFEAEPGSCKRVSVQDGTAAVLLGGARRADTQDMVNLLSAAALAALHQVPMVEDPEPARQPAGTDAADGTGGPPPELAVPMMLMLCGGSPLAVDAMVVHATVSQPQVEACALTGEHCRGVIIYDGLQVAAVDLKSLCGLGALTAGEARQAFVVSMAAGHVAFLVSSVVDVVRTLPGDVKPIPAFALPRADLFAGALALPALRADLAGGNGAAAVCQYLVIDAERLRSCAELLGLAGLNVPHRAQAERRTGLAIERRDAAERPMITYLLNTERATPLDQIEEILAYQPGTAAFQAGGGALLGFMIDRGRSIPVLCLGRLAGEAGSTPTATSSVLLVQSRGELIGFAVPALKSIERAEWEPALPGFGTNAVAARRAGAGAGHRLVLVGAGETERMLPLLDLRAMAATLQQQAGSTARR